MKIHRPGKFLSPVLSLLSILLLTGLDRYGKSLAVQYLKGAEDIVLLPGILRLHYLENRGAAFGILEGRSFLLVVTAGLIGIGILYVLWKLPEDRTYLPLRISLVLLLAGAAGNSLDRAAGAYVIDYLEFLFIDFPVFNAADIYVVCGVIFLIILICFRYTEEELQFLKR